MELGRWTRSRWQRRSAPELDGAQARMWALGRCFTTWGGDKHSVGSSFSGSRGKVRGRDSIVTQVGRGWHLSPGPEGSRDTKDEF